MKTIILAVLTATAMLTTSVRSATMDDKAPTVDDLARALGIALVKKTITTEPGHDLEIWIEKLENGTNSVPWRTTSPGDSVVHEVSVVHRVLDDRRRSINIQSHRIDSQGTWRGQGTRDYAYSVPAFKSSGGRGGPGRSPASRRMEIGREYQIFDMTETRGDYSVTHRVKLRFKPR